MKRFAHETDAILAYSEATRRDVERLLDAPADKVTVAPMAVDEGFEPMDRAEAQAAVRREWGVAAPFLLFVSTLEPRKNVVGLLEGFARLRDRIPHSLVLIGGVGWKAEPIFEALDRLRLGDRVVRPGYVPHRRLPVWYAAADAFVFPTLYEGFGLPLLEALACGCPVVASNSSSVPEVTGGAALLCGPDDTEALAANVLRVLEDDALRADLVDRGRAHAARYSWRAMAEATWGVYQRLAQA
jgi:glycosyltransferase involved in cell wall biosynthesis